MTPEPKNDGQPDPDDREIPRRTPEEMDKEIEEWIAEVRQDVGITEEEMEEAGKTKPVLS